MLVSIRVIVSCCVLIMSVLFAVHVQAENSKPAKKIPKWKQEHMARVANAAKVCGSPTLNPIAKPNDLNTNFYQVNLMPDEMGLYLGVEDGKPILVNSSGKTQEWLLSRVGAGLYKVSACVNEAPLCLTTTADKQLTLAACDAFGYGDQVWWLKGYAVGANKGGWFLGNDGVGQMECLIAGESANGLVLETCTNEQNGWRFNHVNTVKKVGSKKETEPPALDFPQGAEVINYQCDSGASVSTYYDIPKDEMQVRYGGKFLNLKSVVSGSGAKFGNASQPWGWWTKGERGAIYQTTGDEAFIENCQELTTSGDAGRIWTAYQPHTATEKVTIADCADCEEDLGMLIQCQGAGTPALVTVYVMPQNTGDMAKSEIIDMKFDGESKIYTKPAKVVHMGMTGDDVQEFSLPINDPLWQKLASANHIYFAFGDTRASVSLHGSKKAIEIFKSSCN